MVPDLLHQKLASYKIWQQMWRSCPKVWGGLEVGGAGRFLVFHLSIWVTKSLSELLMIGWLIMGEMDLQPPWNIGCWAKWESREKIHIPRVFPLVNRLSCPFFLCWTLRGVERLHNGKFRTSALVFLFGLVSSSRVFWSWKSKNKKQTKDSNEHPGRAPFTGVI